MQDATGQIIVLSPGLSQSFAIAHLLCQHLRGARLLGYRMPGENDPLRRPFLRYIRPEEGEPALDAGTAIMTGSAATRRALRSRESVRWGQIKFEKRNLWFDDKAAALQLARRINIPVPDTWASPEEIGGHIGPIFCKPSQEGTGGPRTKFPSVRALPGSMRGGGYLFQEVIEGPSVIGFGFIADRGRVVAANVHHEILSHPPHGGSAVAVEAYHSPRVEELAGRLIAEFRYSGWGLVEFKPCPKRGDLVLMELNAKFWASLEFTLRTCPLFPYLLFGIETEREPIQRMIWPSRMLRNGLLRIPSELPRLLPAASSQEALTWRDWARLVFPG